MFPLCASSTVIRLLSVYVLMSIMLLSAFDHQNPLAVTSISALMVTEYPTDVDWELERLADDSDDDIAISMDSPERLGDDYDDTPLETVDPEIPEWAALASGDCLEFAMY